MITPNSLELDGYFMIYVNMCMNEHVMCCMMTTVVPMYCTQTYYMKTCCTTMIVGFEPWEDAWPPVACDLCSDQIDHKGYHDRDDMMIRQDPAEDDDEIENIVIVEKLNQKTK